MEEARPPIRIALIAVILILAAILAILLINVVPMALTDSAIAKGQRRVTRSSVTSSVPLAEAAARAQARALEWTRDAVSVRAEAAWAVEGGWTGVQTPPLAWSFTFYSPSAESVAVVVIDDETTLWVPPFEIPVVPTPLGEGLPAHGIETAWLSFRAAGGDAFLEAHPQSQVTFRLQQRAGRPVWTVSAFDEGDFTDVRIDAQSGVVSTTTD